MCLVFSDRVRLLTERRALRALGAEIVEANLSSVSSLASGFSLANAIFVNTDFWGVYRDALASGKSEDEASRLAYDTEISWGKNAAVAALQIPELEKFVYSAFGSMKTASGGKYSRCNHFEAKSVVANHIASDLLELASKTSYVYAAGYSDNPLLFPRKVPFGTSWILWLLTRLPFLMRLFARRPPPSDTKQDEKNPFGGWEYLMVLPGKLSTSLPVFFPDRSTGGYVRCLIEDEPAGTRLLAVDWWIGLEEGIRTWEKVTGRKAGFVEVTVPLLCQLTGRREEVIEGAAYLTQFPYMCEIKDYVEPRELKNPPPKALSFEEYLRSRPPKELLT